MAQKQSLKEQEDKEVLCYLSPIKRSNMGQFLHLSKEHTSTSFGDRKVLNYESRILPKRQLHPIILRWYNTTMVY